MSSVKKYSHSFAALTQKIQCSATFLVDGIQRICVIQALQFAHQDTHNVFQCHVKIVVANSNHPDLMNKMWNASQADKQNKNLFHS